MLTFSRKCGRAIEQIVSLFTTANMMNVFAVGVRRVEHEYVVCVNGLANAKWLLRQLVRSFVFGSARPIGEETGSALCTFRVPCDARLRHAGFNKLLTALPEVCLLSK
jgi:hypothetical protein